MGEVFTHAAHALVSSGGIAFGAEYKSFDGFCVRFQLHRQFNHPAATASAVIKTHGLHDIAARQEFHPRCARMRLCIIAGKIADAFRRARCKARAHAVPRTQHTSIVFIHAHQPIRKSDQIEADLLFARIFQRNFKFYPALHRAHGCPKAHIIRFARKAAALRFVANGKIRHRSVARQQADITLFIALNSVKHPAPAFGKGIV